MKDFDAWYNKGVILDKLGRYDEAIKHYDKALEIDGNYAKAWNSKGSALYNLGRYDEATKCYDKALEIDDKNVDAWYNKGLALYDLGRYDDATKCYDKALEIDDKNALVYYDRACSKCKLNEINESLTDLKTAISPSEEYIDLAAEDDNFESIKDNEQFKLLLSRKANT